MVGDHHSVKRRFGIWFKPDLCAFVNFLYFIDSSKPEAFSLNKTTKLQAYDNTYYMLQTKSRSTRYEYMPLYSLYKQPLFDA